MCDIQVRCRVVLSSRLSLRGCGPDCASPAVVLGNHRMKTRGYMAGPVHRSVDKETLNEPDLHN